MVKRLLFLFEALILLTLFIFFGSLAATTLQNDRIIDETENFVEVARYKGCITKSIYEDFLVSLPTVVDVNFEVSKAPELVTSEDIKDIDFTHEVIEDVYGASGMYTMESGDMLSVTVRKASPTWLDTMIGAMTGEGTTEYPLIAVKGGMILNEQYYTGGGIGP